MLLIILIKAMWLFVAILKCFLSLYIQFSAQRGKYPENPHSGAVLWICWAGQYVYCSSCSGRSGVYKGGCSV